MSEEIPPVPEDNTPKCPKCGGRVVLNSYCMYCTVCEWTPC